MKLDLGAGKNRRGPDYTTVDCRPFEGVDVVADLREKWPFEDESVDDVWCSHVLEHFERLERVHFMNELHRVLKPGKSATIVTPHWCSMRAFGDMDHKWPPVSEFFYFYLNRDWRAANAPHDDFYTCNFALPPTVVPMGRPDLVPRYPDMAQWMVENCREAVQDIVVTITKA